MADPRISPESANVLYDASPRRLSRWRRMQVPVIGGAVSSLLRLIGPTLRFETLGLRHLEAVRARGYFPIGAFWHRCIFSAAWRWRGRGVVVMITANFDGQWTRAALEPLGYGTAVGSSSRGGMRGLLEMEKQLAAGLEVAFAIDGPRGPRYVAKPGAVMLAQRTGQPIILFHSAVDRSVTFRKSWDQFQLPLPFARAVMVVAPPLFVPAGAGAEEMQEKQRELQFELERIRDVAENWFRLSEADRSRLRSEFNG